MAYPTDTVVRLLEKGAAGDTALAGPDRIGLSYARLRNLAQRTVEAMPHKRLGEEVAAAVVLRPGQTATEHDLRDFAAAHLADFKVPRKFIVVDEIPKGATGKLQRAGLAQKLGFEA